MNAISYIGLDEPDEWAHFSRELTRNELVWESSIIINGMHCAACALNIERALLSVPGVEAVNISAATKRALITWTAGLTKPSEWMQAINAAGYEPMPVNELSSTQTRKSEQRLMLWRLLVAGFCMMQVMMYAYPFYIAAKGEITPDIDQLLKWASWILTLPVILFSAIPFLQNAVRDVKLRRVSMDLPVALGIVITFVVSSVVTFQPNSTWGNEVYFDSLTMFVFFLLLGRWFELKMRDKTAGALDVLMSRLPPTVERLQSDGAFKRVPVSQLKIGDTVRVLAGECFPADGVVSNGHAQVDEALLTGESTPVSKTVGDQVVAGSFNINATVECVIDKVGRQTRYAEIVALMESASIEKPRLAKIADKIAKPFLWVVILIACITAIILWPKGHANALMVAVSILIVTCPCALSLATPVSMISAAGALAKQGLLVKKLQSIEAMAKIDTIVFDKTGTLSQQGLVVHKVITYSTYSLEQIKQIANAITAHSLHPISKTIHAYTNDSISNFIVINQLDELAGQGLSAKTSIGNLLLGNATFCNQPMSNEVNKKVYLTCNQHLIATFDLQESVSDTAVDAVKAIKSLGLAVHLLSGDEPQAVKQFALATGIDNSVGGCTPKQKLDYLKHLINQGHRVAMVGDGLNDGPTLALAHVSIAMGDGVPIVQSKADFVLMHNQISMVTMLIKHASKAMQVVKQNLFWAIGYNAICIPLAVMGYLPAWLAGLGMALSSLLVVANASRLSVLPSALKGVA